ncbi:tripartite motif-containing protein 14 [Platysternon megacephalum]|uniref:Tripartite motif-containing protein 14 n=1 Tax=Platysternon megacephalum TaxID=55544 RepID=A0A4D9EFQ5_9SAUR|nr:tripartite motif-containing protein 14 [Platysternon megacephalum]
MTLRRIMTSQPFTNSPSGSLAFQGRLADASLFSHYKEELLESKENSATSETISAAAEGRTMEVIARLTQDFHKLLFYCSRCVLNFRAPEERPFNSYVLVICCTTIVKRSKRFRAELYSQLHQCKSRLIPQKSNELTPLKSLGVHMDLHQCKCPNSHQFTHL